MKKKWLISFISLVPLFSCGPKKTNLYDKLKPKGYAVYTLKQPIFECNGALYIDAIEGRLKIVGNPESKILSSDKKVATYTYGEGQSMSVIFNINNNIATVTDISDPSKPITVNKTLSGKVLGKSGGLDIPVNDLVTIVGDKYKTENDTYIVY